MTLRTGKGDPPDNRAGKVTLFEFDGSIATFDRTAKFTTMSGPTPRKVPFLGFTANPSQTAGKGVFKLARQGTLINTAKKPRSIARFARSR
jgi:hypothetical protein